MSETQEYNAILAELRSLARPGDHQLMGKQAVEDLVTFLGLAVRAEHLMLSFNTCSNVLDDLVKIRHAYDDRDEKMSNMGQPLDGFSALAEFRALARCIANKKADDDK